MIDLMAWNADATRMPYRMHSEYLRHCSSTTISPKAAIKVDGRPVGARRHPRADVRGRHRTDHVAPWRSVYKIHYLADTDVTFVLTSGGHNAGIVSPPAQPGHVYQIMTKDEDAPYIGPY